MTQPTEAIALPVKDRPLRTRLCPERILSSEEIAQRQVARAEFGDRCRSVFEKLRPELTSKYYNWFIAVNPDSEDYLIDPSLEGLIEKIRASYADGIVKLTAFRLNEMGVCGRI